MRHNVEGFEAWQEQAALYALGALDEAERLAFEAHLATGCEACAEELQPFEMVVAALGMSAPEVAPPADVRDKLLSRISTGASQQLSQTPSPSQVPTPAQTPTPSQTASRADTAAPQFMTLLAGEGEWQELSTGVFIKQLFVDREKGSVTSLYKLLPGAQAAAHRHDGIEQCYVLEGDFQVNEESLGPGDFTCAMPGSVHQTVRTTGGALLLIVAQAGYLMTPAS